MTSRVMISESLSICAPPFGPAVVRFSTLPKSVASGVARQSAIFRCFVGDLPTRLSRIAYRLEGLESRAAVPRQAEYVHQWNRVGDEDEHDGHGPPSAQSIPDGKIQFIRLEWLGP